MRKSGAALRRHGSKPIMIAQILVADDDPAITSLIAERLTHKKHKIIAAKDGFELVQKASQYCPHLIIADIMMPGAYGSSVYHILQKDHKTSAIPILFMSAHSYQSLKKILPDDPKTRFIQKPLSFAKMDELIFELLPLGGYVP